MGKPALGRHTPCSGLSMDGVTASKPGELEGSLLKAIPARNGRGCQHRFGIPFWLVGEFTTHFRAYCSGDWDVHGGYGVLAHSQMGVAALSILYMILGR